jgi:hypothetical protein
MPTAYKVLGQLEPSAATLSTLYTVPSSTQAVCSTLFIANTSTNYDIVRVAVRKSGASISNSHYVYYDLTLSGKQTLVSTIGLTLDTTDVVSVYSSGGVSAFNLFGTEIS